MRHIVGNVVVLVSVVIGSQFTLIAQDDAAKSSESKAAQERLDYMYGSAAGFVGERDSDGAQLTIYEKPLLRFTNPLHGCREGLFVAWVDSTNRPVAVGQIFLMRGSENDWYLETQSFADGPIKLESESNGSWSPSMAGITWSKFKSDSPEPSRTKALRLTQMRRLAARFRVEDNLLGDEDVLRLMSNPMIRYEDRENGVIDGALFAYVQGTDPELLVQLEAREDEDGKQEYVWALGAMTSAAVNAFLDQDPVWSKERSAGGPEEVFYMRPLTGGVAFPME